MTFTFDRLGFAAAFFLGSFSFFLSPPASAGAAFPCFSAASACSRNSRMFRVLLAMNARRLLNGWQSACRTGGHHSDRVAKWLLCGDVLIGKDSPSLRRQFRTICDDPLEYGPRRRPPLVPRVAPGTRRPVPNLLVSAVRF